MPIVKSRTGRVEAGGFQVQDQLGLLSMTLSPKKKKKKKFLLNG
jgi:hypothetical protein